MALQSGIKTLQLSKVLCRNYASAGKLVDVAVNDKTGVATVTMQRLPVNSLNLDLLNDLSTTFTHLENNKCRGMILTSASNSVFSAGLDIMEMYKPDPDRVRSFWTTLQEMWIKLYGSAYPTVAVINGHSPAGGCLISMSCEYRIMLPKFTIGLNETQLGIVAPTWFAATMKNTIGTRQTELALTQGRLFSTDEALQIGMVDEVAQTKEEGLSKAEQFLNKFARISPMARFASKQVVRGKDIQNLAKNREQDLNAFIDVVTLDKVQQGLQMYIESLKKKKA
ncbi:enoyl-CoA delta isomerase 1, mitochondrial-like [Aethina tumida]|uniref:enoyl-CoA delta isomerase 1, mitochondrial-like n=1 Tax=Aethina tumida TaxID=116153 RepID=UPI002147E9AD|nr:enoyl-CoA delta isomerase 1, mitochondrial-like [Aethina tumida]